MEKLIKINGSLRIKPSLFSQVKEHISTHYQVELKLDPQDLVTNDEVTTFLSKNPDIAGSIIGFDEVDTSDRYEIWDRLKSHYAVKRINETS